MRIVYPADILLPKVKDMTAWSVVACDQFTAQPEYWTAVEERIGEKPSTLRLILPEAWLGTHREKDAPERIARTMTEWLSAGLFEEQKNCLIYLERTLSDGRMRRGLMAALDLEQYDFKPETRLPVRASEETVTDRLPLRLRIRRLAPLELPHAMVLMDDRDDRVLGPLEKVVGDANKLYDFQLMCSGGHVSGWRVDGALLERTLSAVDSLGDAALQREKYGSACDRGPLALAVGDGNHSLAGAKQFWNELKPALDPGQRETHPARFALVELCNIHDRAMTFAPIHRVLFDTDALAAVAAMDGRRQEWEDPARPIGERVAAADAFCREQLEAHGGRVDFIHGEQTVRELGARPGCAALILPPVKKEGLFPWVLTRGALPRKSFSMGRAEDKRYYLECRAIR